MPMIIFHYIHFGNGKGLVTALPPTSARRVILLRRMAVWPIILTSVL